MADRLQRVLQRTFGSRLGWAARMLVPLLFLAAVAVPLKHALDEVAWEVATRDAVRRALPAPLVRDVSLPAEPLTAHAADDTAWISLALAALNGIRSGDGLAACVERPSSGAQRSGLGGVSREAIDHMLSVTPAARAGQLVVSEGASWSVRVVRGRCEAPGPAPS